MRQNATFESISKISLDYNKLVEHELKVYLRQRAKSLTSIIKRGREEYPIVASTLSKKGLPELLSNIAVIESAYRPSAVSPAGAKGLWQFTAATGKNYGLVVTPLLDERNCPIRSTQAAASLFANLYNAFGDWNLALAAYNAGEFGIKKAMERTQARDFWELAESGVLPEETRRFVPRFIAVSIIDLLERTYGSDKIESNLSKHIALHSGRRLFALNISNKKSESREGRILG